jgi:hypothetical protein
MAKTYTLNVDELSEERQAQIAEQAKKHEEDAAQWHEIFGSLDERVLTPVMAEVAAELGETGKWVGSKPKTATRLSGTGIKSAGQFEVPGTVEGGTRPVDVSVELFPTTNRRFIAYVDVGGKVERKTFELSEFDENQVESDQRLRSWLGTQFDKHVRKKAYH